MADSLHQRIVKLYAGVIFDAMYHDLGVSRPFVLDRAVKPGWKLDPHQILFGHAFTCKGQRVLHASDVDESVRLRMFQDFTEGCVQVIDTDGDDSVAHFGDISGRIARKFGCRGAVIDGNVRDIRLLEEDQFPIFCRGIQPIDAYGKWQITEYQTIIHMRGIQGTVEVAPGDFLFADLDGVLVIPESLIEQVCSHAEKRLEIEVNVRNRLKDYSDIQLLNDEVGRW
jgi:regulator of RNase E activity RraA